MPTPAERKALLFFSVVLVLGASTRAFRALQGGSPGDARARSALESQIKAADSARRAGLRKPKRQKARKTAPKPTGKVDLDVAGEKEIEALRGIGPALASKLAPVVTFSGTPRPLSAAPPDSSARRRAARPRRHPGT